MNSGETSLTRKGRQEPPETRVSTATQKKRPSAMDIRRLEAMLQVAKETAEAERKAREEEKKAEKKEILELRQETATLRKEKEAYEAMYGQSE